MTEHLIPAWVFRAFQRRRRPQINVLRHHLPAGEFDDYHGPRQETAKVICCVCNNGWISVLDDAAARQGRSRLREHAPALMETGVPPDFFEVWHGPPSMEPRQGFAVFGLTPHQGKLVLGTGSEAEVVPLSAWSLMLGYCDLLLRPLFRWIPLEDPPAGFQRLWPCDGSAIEISPQVEALPASVHCVPTPSWPQVVRS
jgi:hypothetical protein